MTDEQTFAILSRDRKIRELEQELAALKKGRGVPAVPEGWKLVPIEPTDEMIEVGCDVANAYRVDIARAYEAMLAAAPEVKS